MPTAREVKRHYLSALQSLERDLEYVETNKLVPVSDIEILKIPLVKVKELVIEERSGSLLLAFASLLLAFASLLKLIKRFNEKVDELDKETEILNKLMGRTKIEYVEELSEKMAKLTSRVTREESITTKIITEYSCPRCQSEFTLPYPKTKEEFYDHAWWASLEGRQKYQLKEWWVHWGSAKSADEAGTWSIPRPQINR